MINRLGLIVVVLIELLVITEGLNPFGRTG
ncbi:MAG: hypothetical protein MAG451_00683 [Anaerolineales bacterium]|nr:hypothetical protein [Anaerolineales bacterium]